MNNNNSTVLPVIRTLTMDIKNDSTQLTSNKTQLQDNKKVIDTLSCYYSDADQSQ